MMLNNKSKYYIINTNNTLNKCLRVKYKTILANLEKYV